MIPNLLYRHIYTALVLLKLLDVATYMCTLINYACIINLRTCTTDLDNIYVQVANLLLQIK